MSLFTCPLPQDLARLVLDYTLGPDTNEHLAHFRLIEQLRSLNEEPFSCLVRRLRPWSRVREPDGYGAIKYFNASMLKVRFDKYHGAYMHAIWPFFVIMSNLTKYTRPFA